MRHDSTSCAIEQAPLIDGLKHTLKKCMAFGVHLFDPILCDWPYAALLCFRVPVGHWKLAHCSPVPDLPFDLTDTYFFFLEAQEGGTRLRPLRTRRRVKKWT